ncbi:flavin reductase like domain-containing protein, partial [Gymnopilus junonius]
SSRRLKSDLRTLLRDIAQPVAVVTSFMPHSHSHPHQGGKAVCPENGSPYHGATLSSFTSIAMDPYPLVSFALRIPSRMATTLSSLSSLPFSSASSAHMVINLLSSSQASTALAFSRPDLFPAPFLGSTSSPASGRIETDAIPYTLSQDGLPIINDVIGALSCELVGGPIALHDLEYLSRASDSPPSVPVLRPGEVASELFIARVVRVEEVKRDAQEDERTLQPLIYHRRGYTS